MTKLDLERELKGGSILISRIFFSVMRRKISVKHSESLWMILKHDYIILEELICILNVREKGTNLLQKSF